MTYSQHHPDRCKALILRGVFLCRKKEVDFFYQQGTSWFFPEAYKAYSEVIPEVERGHLLSAFHRRVTGDDEEEKMKCAKAWSSWEMSTSKLEVDPKDLALGEDPVFALAFARIEIHYFINGGFFPTDTYLLDNVRKISHIPAVIIQGRYDMVCPAASAFELHEAWPEADFRVVGTSGHSASEPGIIHELVEATDKFADLEM